MPALILQPATDWTGQTHEKRLHHAVQALFVHGLLGFADFERISARIRLQADTAREKAAR